MVWNTTLGSGTSWSAEELTYLQINSFPLEPDLETTEFRQVPWKDPAKTQTWTSASPFVPPEKEMALKEGSPVRSLEACHVVLSHHALNPADKPQT